MTFRPHSNRARYSVHAETPDPHEHIMGVVVVDDDIDDEDDDDGVTLSRNNVSSPRALRKISCNS